MRAPPLFNAGSSGGLDIPDNSGHLVHPRHASGHSHGSPAGTFSVLSALSAAPYNTSGRSSFDEGRSGADALLHMRSMRGRDSSGVPPADLRDVGHVDSVLSRELEAARSGLLSGMHAVSMSGEPLRSPGGAMLGTASPQAGGHFGGHFRGASAGSAAGPSNYSGYGSRSDISALGGAVPRVVEGSPRVQLTPGFTSMPISPGQLENAQHR